LIRGHRGPARHRGPGRRGAAVGQVLGAQAAPRAQRPVRRGRRSANRGRRARSGRSPFGTSSGNRAASSGPRCTPGLGSPRGPFRRLRGGPRSRARTAIKVQPPSTWEHAPDPHSAGLPAALPARACQTRVPPDSAGRSGDRSPRRPAPIGTLPGAGPPVTIAALSPADPGASPAPPRPRCP
jgi:hypothetical protein